MKKIISLLLVICIICPLLSGCVQDALTDDQKTKIIEDYLSWSGLKGDLSVEDVKCTFLGKFGNSVAVYFKSAGAYDVTTEETVAGYTFTYPDSRVIRVWNEGKFYKMTDAYGNGLIDEKSVKNIYIQSSSITKGKPLFIFEEKIYCDFDKYKHPEYGMPDYLLSDRKIMVVIDVNLSSPNKVFDDAFFENVKISSISDETEYQIRYYPYEPYRQYFRIVLSEPSKENIKNAVAVLESKEGVREVRPYTVPQPGLVSNDPYYDASNIQDSQWGLKSIEIQKVWDFTTEN